MIRLDVVNDTFSYYVCNMESYHRVPKVCLRRFRIDGDDEPLRYAPRTLIVVKAMKVASHRGIRNWRKKLVRS